MMCVSSSKMCKLTSTKSETVKKIVKLKKKSERDKANLFVVEGYKLVEEAIGLGIVREIYAVEPYPDARLVTPEVMKKLSSLTTPPGVLALVEKPNERLTDRVLVVENLSDPGNLGTILRTAEAFGFSVGLLGDTVDPYNPKVVQASMGSIFRTPFAHMDEEMLTGLRARMDVYASALDPNAAAYDSFVYPEKLAILIGSESHGLREKTLKIASKTLYIPMEGKVESLNAGIAAAILMQQAKR